MQNPSCTDQSTNNITYGTQLFWGPNWKLFIFIKHSILVGCKKTTTKPSSKPTAQK